MSKIRLDETTKEMASEYANNEAELKGFKVGSSRWKDAFKHYCEFAAGTLAVGRNPSRRNPSDREKEFYQDVYGSGGFAGRVAPNVVTQEGTGISLTEAQNRISSSVNNLALLFQNGIMNVKTTTHGKSQGKIANSDMSELQFPNKEDFPDQDQWDAAARDTIYNWFMGDLIRDAVLESLLPFFNLDKKDVEDILSAVNIEQADIQEMKSKGRAEFIRRLRTQAQPKMKDVSYKKIILG